MAKASTRSNDPVGLRNRVLDVAAQSFQLVGFTATSTHDIVRKAGITGGALHHHFPTKKSLALAVISERVANELGETWVTTVRDAPSAAVGILAAFDTVAAALDAQGSVSGCPLGNLALELSLSDSDLRDALANEYAAWRDAISDRIQHDRDQGRAGYASDPVVFANVVVALFTGAMTVAKAEQSTVALRAAAGQLRMMMAGDLGC